jgi:transcriptional regulator with XRE-family HTH domain
MPPKTNPHGPTTETVAANVRRVREARGYSQAQLSDRLAELGHTIPTIGVRRIENLGRGVSVDDLIALALALRVSPTSLLVPQPGGGWSVVDREITGHPDPVSPRRVCRWLTADTPLDPAFPSIAEVTRFRARSAVCDDHLGEILAAAGPIGEFEEKIAVAQGDVYPADEA